MNIFASFSKTLDSIKLSKLQNMKSSERQSFLSEMGFLCSRNDLRESDKMDYTFTKKKMFSRHTLSLCYPSSFEETFNHNDSCIRSVASSYNKRMKKFFIDFISIEESGKTIIIPNLHSEFSELGFVKNNSESEKEQFSLIFNIDLSRYDNHVFLTLKQKRIVILRDAFKGNNILYFYNTVEESKFAFLIEYNNVIGLLKRFNCSYDVANDEMKFYCFDSKTGKEYKSENDYSHFAGLYMKNAKMLTKF